MGKQSERLIIKLVRQWIRQLSDRGVLLIDVSANVLLIVEAVTIPSVCACACLSG